MNELSEIPVGAVTIFSAHGVSKAVEAAAERRNLPVIDATCPLVSKVHMQGRRYLAQGRALILIGHAGHPEVEGTMGQFENPISLVQTVADVAALDLPHDAPVAYVTQTTLSVDDTRAIIQAIHDRFDNVRGPDVSDICYATQNRQAAVRDLTKLADVILVVGAKNSSNSNRLREIGEEAGIPSYLVADGGELDLDWVRGAGTIGLTAGASAPEISVHDVIASLRRLGDVHVSTLPGVQESIEFRLPAQLREAEAPVAISAN